MKRPFAWTILILALCTVTPFATARPAAAATLFTVNSTLDLPDIAPGNGLCRTVINTCTLRAAIQETNALPGNDTITLPAGTFTLTRVGSDNTALNGDLDLLEHLTINGAGAALTIIDGNGNTTNDRVFHTINGSFTMTGLTLRNGKALHPNLGGGILHDSGQPLALTNIVVSGNTATGGGGIRVGGGSSLTLTDSTLSGNTATIGTGGGMDIGGGAATLTRSTISNNTAGAGGGGISHVNGALHLIDSTVSGNTASGGSAGGGILSNSPSILTIAGSTINNNFANSGGGILNSGNGSLVNSTVSGNSVKDEGGGIRQTGGLLDLSSVTITNNTADSDFDNDGNGGGIHLFSPEVATFKNTIIAGNRDLSRVAGAIIHRDCSGALTSQGYNLIQNTTGCTISGDLTGNITGVSPNLGTLQDNGGFTLTHFLYLTSPALDAGNPNGCTDASGNLLLLDQRGVGRHQSDTPPARCDIGSYERGDFPH